MTNWTCGTTRADRSETRNTARAPTGADAVVGKARVAIRIPLDKGVSDAWKACAADGAAAAGVVWDAPEPGLGSRVRMRVCGPRSGGPGWSNEGAGFRRRTSVCPPPHLPKCRATLPSTAERCGKTAVPSWNSRSGRSETRNADRALTGRTRWSGRQGLPSASLGQGSAGYVEGVRRRWRGGSGCGVVCSVTRAWEPGPDAGLRAALLRARVVEPGCGLQATCARLPLPSFT